MMPSKCLTNFFRRGSRVSTELNMNCTWHGVQAGLAPGIAWLYPQKLTSQSISRYFIGLFVRPQTQRERNVVRFSVAVCGEDTKNDCVADTPPPPTKGKISEYRIYDWSCLLNVFACFLSQACIHQKSTSALAGKRELSNWSVQWSKSQIIEFHHRVTVRNCVFIYR